MATGFPIASRPLPSEGVILLHGLLRSHRSMTPLAALLRRHGYLVVNAQYASRRAPIEALADSVLPAALLRMVGREDLSRIHVITHSMGAILLRSYLSRHAIQGLDKVLMFCPPNQGSELVDYFGRFWWFKAIIGPAGMQLGASSDSLPRRLGGNIPATLGVISGDRGAFGLFNRILPGRNDGKVSVASTRLAGMADHLILPYGHTFIMYRRQAQQQTLFFLQHGVFHREQNDG